MLFGRLTEADFWKWFQSKSDELFRSKMEDQKLLSELHGKLNKVKKGLAFEISQPLEDGTREFIISADGIRERIPFVESLVHAAPAMPTWKVIAFRPKKEGLSIQFQNHKLGVDDLYFDADLNGRLVDLKVYIPGFTGDPEDPLIGAAFILLDCAVGEYAMMTRVGEIDWRKLPDNPAEKNLEPLSKLGERFDAMQSILG